MSEVKLYHGDCLIEMNKIADKSVDLILCDPPYYKVISEKWDNVWKTKEDYIEWCKKWFLKSYNKLRIGGSFYLFGYFRILVLLVPLLQELGFSLRQQIIIDKGIKSVSGRATKNYKMFPNVTESILFLVKDNIPYSRNFLKIRQKELGLTSKEINEALGVKSNGGGMWSIYTGKNICEQFPTKELWGKLQKILQFDLPYEKISQTFNAEMGITDVWKDIDFYKEERFHPTQKPINLLKRIIKASSNENDVVLDCFMGSGSTGVACINTNRNFIGIELDDNYFKIAEDRINKVRETIFDM
jgi:DNA modification methylase